MDQIAARQQVDDLHAARADGIDDKRLVECDSQEIDPDFVIPL